MIPGACACALAPRFAHAPVGTCERIQNIEFLRLGQFHSNYKG